MINLPKQVKKLDMINFKRYWLSTTEHWLLQLNNKKKKIYIKKYG